MIHKIGDFKSHIDFIAAKMNVPTNAEEHLRGLTAEVTLRLYGQIIQTSLPTAFRSFLTLCPARRKAMRKVLFSRGHSNPPLYVTLPSFTDPLTVLQLPYNGTEGQNKI